MSKLEYYLGVIGELQLTTVIHFNMGYYATRIDEYIHKLCTILLPWRKYQYQYLPVMFSIFVDIFQKKMSTLFQNMMHMCIYIDNLIFIIYSIFENTWIS